MNDGQESTREIRGVFMCESCYVIALEHYADWSFSATGPLLSQRARMALEQVKKAKEEYKKQYPPHRVAPKSER